MVKYRDLVLQIGYGMGMCTEFLEQIHNSLICCNIKYYSILRYMLWLCLSLVGGRQDVMIRFESIGQTMCCIVITGIFMESMVRCWAEDTRRNSAGKLLLGIIKPVCSGSEEQYKYCYI